MESHDSEYAAVGGYGTRPTAATETTTIPAATSAAADALAGPWEAVLAYASGDVTTWDDFDGNFFDDSDLDDITITIARRSALPGGSDSVGSERLPSAYNGEDLLVEFDGFEEFHEVEARWVQAQAMAAGLNAAAQQVTR